MKSLTHCDPNKNYTVHVLPHALSDSNLLRGSHIKLLTINAGVFQIQLEDASLLSLSTEQAQEIFVTEKNEQLSYCLLAQLTTNSSACIVGITGEKAFKRRLMDMGLTPGTRVHLKKVAPLGDPIELKLRGYALSLRKKEAAAIIVSQEVCHETSTRSNW